MRMVVGNKPMGLRPPSVVGNSTTMTTPARECHLPILSAIANNVMNSEMVASLHLASALGWTLSHPSPVAAGKV